MSLMHTVVTTTTTGRTTPLDFLRAAVWQLFDASSDQSFRFHVGPVPVSIKIAKLEPLIVQWVGARV